MKFLMQVGTQLDLDVAYNGGAADAGLIYTVPEDNGFITVNISTGVVDAVAEGESVVWVYSGTPSVLVATVVIEVASAATYAERLAIRDGDNEVVVSAASVLTPVANIKISPTLAQYYEAGPSGYIYFAGNFGPGFVRGAGVDASGNNLSGRYDFLWDGDLNSYWYAQSANGAAGYYSENSTTIKEVKIWSNHQNLTARPTHVIVYGSNVTPTDSSGYGNPSFRFDDATGWEQIASSDIIWGGTVSELRTIDLSANMTQYKHYKAKLVCNEAYVALGGIEFWGIA
jgi:hypothetical protein